MCVFLLFVHYHVSVLLTGAYVHNHWFSFHLDRVWAWRVWWSVLREHRWWCMWQCDTSLKQYFCWQYRSFFLLCLLLIIIPIFAISDAGIVLCVDSFTTASQGKMYSINYPDQYEDNLNCSLTYHFNTTVFPPRTRKHVIFDIQEFSMEECCDHFVVADQTGESLYSQRYTLTGSLKGTHKCMLIYLQYVNMQTCVIHCESIYLCGKILQIISLSLRLSLFLKRCEEILWVK